MMRVGLLCLVAAMPVRLYTALFQAAAPDLDPRIGVESAWALAALGAFLVLVAALGLRHRTKKPWRAVGSALLEQPGWWSAWYPRAFRRSGDVWHRLPRRIRLSRTAVALTAVWFLFVSVPLPLVALVAQFYEASAGVRSPVGELLARGRVSQAAGVMLLLPFVALIGLTTEVLIHGRRLTQTLGPKLADPRQAAKALGTPSWKRSFWEKPPFDSLLLPETRALSPDGGDRQSPPEPAAPGSEIPTATQTTDAPTRER
jgi:hypothetical protein